MHSGIVSISLEVVLILQYRKLILPTLLMTASTGHKTNKHQVWNFCIPEGRMIRVKAWAYDRPTDRYRFLLEMEQERSIPVLFNICRESREIAQRTFILGMNEIRDTQKLYWNPESDIFYLNLRTLRIRNPRYSRIRTLHESLHVAQNLGLRICPGLWYSLTRGTCAEWLHEFPNLKHLHLIIEPREGCGPWDWTNLITDLNDVGIVEEVFAVESFLPSRVESVEEVSGLHPAYVQSVVVQKFEQYKAANDPEWVPPIVEVHHMPELESSSQYES
jgi:hypothetical protein